MRISAYHVANHGPKLKPSSLPSKHVHLLVVPVLVNDISIHLTDKGRNLHTLTYCSCGSHLINYYPLNSTLGFPCGSAGKEPACNAGDLGSIPGLGRSPKEGKGYPLQYSGLENSKGSQTVREDWVTFTFLQILLYKYLSKLSKSLL